MQQEFIQTSIHQQNIQPNNSIKAPTSYSTMPVINNAILNHSILEQKKKNFGEFTHFPKLYNITLPKTTVFFSNAAVLYPTVINSNVIKKIQTVNKVEIKKKANEKMRYPPLNQSVRIIVNNIDNEGFKKTKLEKNGH
ncbi:uncharacterized protein LOC111627778 [Centruroides sculpturatus]|uniref:uncharacterized protein LOC111627778 n=1 Tax=Centruroides sculpturatus TaxID=218467 RepID=UPI000C6DA8FC|nr:uncharacterized protein LOC111627778 [Centruroides sculpturatus]